MAILPKLVGLSYKEISLQGIAPDSVYTAFWPAAHYLIKETLPETLACVTRWIIALIGTNGYLLIWCEKVRKKNIVEIGGKKERSNKCQKPAQKLITAQRHSKACAEEYMPSPPLGHYHSKKYPICSEGLHYCRSRKMAFGLFVGAIALWYHVSAFCFLLSYFVSQLWTSTIKSIAGKREGRRGYWKVVAMRTQSVELWWTFTGG